MFISKKQMMMSALLILLAATILMASGGSARFTASKSLFAAGTEIAQGQYDVKWEANGSDASVVFTPVGKAKGITVKGKIEQADKKFESNSMAIGKDSSDRPAIKNLQFSGKNIRIVFE